MMHRLQVWAVNQPHRIGPWWLCRRCLITGEWHETSCADALPEETRA